MERILPYRMLEDCQYETEENEIKVYEEMLVALVEGQIDVATAARQITDTLCDEVMRERRLSKSADEDRTYPTNKSVVSIGIGSIASCFPPSHAAHRKLWQLIGAFMTLEPKRQIPSPLVDNNGNIVPSRKDWVYSEPKPILFWTDVKQLLFEAHLLRMGDEGRSHRNGVDKVNSEEQARWRNLSFFFARLTTEGIADLAHMSALFMLQPEQQLAKTTSVWSGYLAAQTIAAAQWIIPEGHGAWVWRQCRTNTQTTDVDLFHWTVEHWNQWKEALTELAGLHDDPNVPEIARRLSSTALEEMGRLESDDPVV
ncbi:hypothetical protein KC349_g7230 [Hortaea werneckii]|nr:hypothetical protein KC349_g7230 [Hortaea werneckii]